MSDNDSKLDRSRKFYSILKAVQDFLPLLTAIAQIVTLSLTITLFIATAKIQDAENAQAEYQKTLPELRRERDAKLKQILENQNIQLLILNQILSSQAKGETVTKATLDSLNIYIFKQHK